MTEPSSPRRTFLGGVLSGAAALWVSATGLASTVLAACEPTTKYGGPPPDMQPTKYGGPPPPDPVEGDTASGPNPTDSAEAPVDEGAGGAAADAGATPTATAEQPVAPKYGGPVTVTPPEPGPPIATKYGGPLVAPKYGGPPPPPMQTKYGGPRKYGGPPLDTF
jgi:hypothetical protein